MQLLRSCYAEDRKGPRRFAESLFFYHKGAQRISQRVAKVFGFTQTCPPLRFGRRRRRGAVWFDGIVNAGFEMRPRCKRGRELNSITRQLFKFARLSCLRQVNLRHETRTRVFIPPPYHVRACALPRQRGIFCLYCPPPAGDSGGGIFEFFNIS